MSGLLYFLPGRRAATATAIAAAGLSDVVEHFAQREALTGPGGESGLVIAPACPDGKAAQCGYFPASQHWVAATCGRYWIGRETDNPPLPEDLQRPEMVAGHLVALEDGNEWLIPVARHFAQGTALPQALLLGPDGQLVAEALPRFAKLSSHAERAFDDFCRAAGSPNDAEGEPLTIAEIWAIAIEALALNYRISAEEVSFLHLLTTQNTLRIAEALIDWPTAEAAIAANAEAAVSPQKKNSTGESASSSDGEPETDQ